MRHTVAVVLCTHNGAQFLHEQLNSLENQSVPPDQIVISDDASTDTTRDIIAEFRRNTSIYVLQISNNPGLGFRENFLRAASSSTCEWVAFCDQDDIWDRSKIEVCSKHFSDVRVCQIVHQATLVDAGGINIGKYFQNIGEDRLVKPLSYDPWSTFLGFSMIVRRSLFDVVRPDYRFPAHDEPRTIVSHDRWAFFLAQTLGYTVEIAQPLVKYRQHGTNLYSAHGPNHRLKYRLRTRAEAGGQHSGRVEAARGMLRAVETFDSSVQKKFPAFDAEAALHFYQRLVSNVEMRAHVYGNSRLRNFVMLSSAGRAGV